MSQIIWAIDAGQVSLEGNLKDFPLYRNSLINEFLDRDEKYVLLGPKGVGKTLLLKLKSIEYRKKGITCYPSEQLCEIVMRGDTNFRPEELAGYQSSDQWKTVWRLVLAVLALRVLNIRLSIGSDAFPYADVEPRLDAILGQVLRNRAHLSTYDEFFTSCVAPTFSSINVPFAAFLDRLDETLGKHTGAPLRRFETEKFPGDGHLSYEVWLSAQFGLMEAVRELREKNPHLKFFVTGRYEAFRAHLSATAHNLSAICIDLRYTRWELRQMFELKLEALKQISQKSFIEEKNKDLYESFFGFSNYKHPRVRGVTGEATEEHIFDCLLRHSRGSPRDLEDIAREIGGLPPSERTQEKIRKVINTKANDFFDFARGQALPYWPDEMDAFLRKIGTNVISKQVMVRLTAAFSKANTNVPDALEFLFRHGLVGYTLLDEESGELLQIFSVNDPDEPATVEELRSSAHYLIHPCADAYIQSVNPDYKRDSFTLVGHGKKFRPNEPVCHVHFGAGKIGCGLVIPLLKTRQDVSVCVIQRPSSRWSTFIQERAVNIRICANSDERTESFDFLAISDRVPAKRFSAYVNEWRHGNRDILLLTSQSERIQAVLAHTQSVSTSVRQEPIVGICTEIAAAERGRPLAIFPFENDEKCFDQFRAELDGFQRIKVFDVVLDRLCTHQQIEGNRIDVTTEDYAAVYIHGETYLPKKFALLRVATDNPVPLARIATDTPVADVKFIHSKPEFEFYRTAKRSLVNALHSATAICGYYELLRTPQPIPANLWGSHIFQLIVRDPDIKEIIGPIASFFSARILAAYRKHMGRNIVSNDDMYEKACYLKQLTSLSWSRMRMMPDSLSRILPAQPNKMAKKYDQFFRDISRREIKAVFTELPDVQSLGIDVDESMVLEAWKQVDDRYSKVLHYLVANAIA